jgi:Uma2 family endonuclease
MGEAAKDLPYTLSDWIELEKSATVRHEFEDGVFRAMTGGTTAHNLITLNLAGALKPLVKKHGCRRYAVDVKTVANGRGYYPDVMVACQPFDGGHSYVEYNPCFIVEVLSPTSVKRDYGEKRTNYMLMPSLEQYVLVHTDKVQVEVYRRREGYWQFTEYKTLEDVLEVVCLNETISLEQIYDDVVLELDEGV